MTLDTEVSGLSGLTRDEHGAFWAPGENGDAVIRIDPETFAVTRYETVGTPDGTDFEAITWMDGARFMLGTETQETGRLQDAILDGRLDAGRFSVKSVGNLEYARWQLTASANHGIEGMCHVGGVLVLATELVHEHQGRRWAPIGVFETATQAWSAHWVALTSETGKLAALDCREHEGVIEALTVERHFGVSHLLRFEVPRGLESQWIEPAVAANLAALISPLPNFEGLAWLPDGSVALLTDNCYRRRVDGPSRLFFVPASVLR